MQQSLPIPNLNSGVQQSSSIALHSEAEQEAAAAASAPTDLAPGVYGGNNVAVIAAELQVVSSSSHTEALRASSCEEVGKLSDSSAAHSSHTSSSAESAAAANGLDGFLHTVTTADEVLNELLGDLSRSSSSSSAAQMSQPSSSSALPDLASTEDADISAAQLQPSSSSVLTADAAVLSSSPEKGLADGICASSSALGLSHMPDSVLHSPRTPTEFVLDTLLDDLRSAELARQSSSSVLLSRLNSLAELRRRSASSSPVAGSSSQADVWRQAPSSPPAADPRFAADPKLAYLRHQLSSREVAEVSKGIEPGQHCSCSSSSAPRATVSSPFMAHQDPCLSSTGNAAGEEDGQDIMASEEEDHCSPAVRVAEEGEWVDKGLQRVSTTDLVLEGLLRGVSEPALDPVSVANQVCTRPFCQMVKL